MGDSKKRFAVQDAGKPVVRLPGPGQGKGTVTPAKQVKKPGMPDARNVNYAFKGTNKVFKGVSPALAGKFAIYKGLEHEGLVPPIKDVIGSVNLTDEVIILIMLIAGLYAVYFAYRLLVESTGEFHRG